MMVGSGKSFRFWFLKRNGALSVLCSEGDTQGGVSPLVGGADSIDVCQRCFAGEQRASAWGELARPSFSREGNGKGMIKNSLLPQAKKLDFQYEC